MATKLFFKIFRFAALCLFAGSWLAALVESASAQAYPSRPVRLIVTTGAGSGPDVIGRITAEHLGRLWNQQVFVVNHPGAAGSIGMKAAGTSPNDGYTLLFAQSSTFVALPEIQASFPYDLLRDFVPIGFVGEQPIAMAVMPSLGVSTLKEFIDLAKAKPGTLNIGVLSRGGIPHLTAEWLKIATGTDMAAVNYSGAPGAMADLIGGRLQAMFDGLPGMAGNVEAGTIRLIATGAAKRLPNLPSVPTAAETLPGFVARGFFALMAPPGTAADIAAKVSDDLRKVVSDPEVIAKLHKIATYTNPGGPADLVAYVKAEQQNWKPVIEKIGMKAGTK